MPDLDTVGVLALLDVDHSNLAAWRLQGRDGRPFTPAEVAVVQDAARYLLSAAAHAARGPDDPGGHTAPVSWPMCGPPSVAARPRSGWQPQAPAAEATVTPLKRSRATWHGLSAATAELTGRLNGITATPDETVSPDATIAALGVIAAAALRKFLPDHGERLLRDLGLTAAEEAGQQSSRQRPDDGPNAA